MFLRSKLRLVGLAFAAATVMGVLAANAAADAPSITRGGSFTVPVHPLSGVCAFDLMSGATVNYTERDYVDSSGALARSAYHIVERDTFAAHGVTLTSDWMDSNFEWRFDASGNPTTVTYNGIIERVHLPGGGVFISAGRIDYSADGFPDFVLTPDHGGSHDLDAFCATLAG